MNILRKSMVTSLLASTFAFTLSAGIACAQTPTDTANGAPSAPSQSDQATPNSQQTMRHHRGDMSTMTDSQFASAAATGGMAEIKLGQLAEDKGTNDAVKAFGKRMFEDHTKAGDDLKAAAVKSNINIPTDVTARDQATYDRLAKLSGSAFDQAYATQMVRDHARTIAAFKHESESGTDANIKSFAAETLPTLQQHLKQARQMAQAVGAPIGPGTGRRNGNPNAAPDSTPGTPSPSAPPQN